MKSHGELEANLKNTSTRSSCVVVEFICVYGIAKFEKSLFVHFVGRVVGHLMEEIPIWDGL